MGELPVLQYCPVEQLQVDDRYQRSLEAANSITLIRRIAINWDWGLCQPLYVARRADGRLYIVDGQHRWAAAKLRGDIWQLPCVVRSFETTEQEAAAFVALNQERTPLSALQMFRASVASGNPESADILATIEEAGLSLAVTTNNHHAAKGAVTNIGGLRLCYRVHGRQVLLESLRVLKGAYPGQILRYAGTIFPGIVALVSSNANDATALIAITKFIAWRTQDAWVSKILQLVAEQPKMNRALAAAIVFKNAFRQDRDPPKSPVAMAPPPTPLAPAEMAWCEQCDQRRSGSQAASCASQFCKLKAQAA